MQTGNNIIQQDKDIRNVILHAIINFKTLSRQLRQQEQNSKQLSNLALYTLLLLQENSSILRNDIMKKFHVNYYDAGSAINQLITNGLIIKEVLLESSSIKTIQIKRSRYRLSLNGAIFTNDIIENIIDIKL